MSSDISATVDPFAPTALDEETELRALAHALKLAQGFKLIFARCNQPQQRKKLITTLRKSLGDFDIQEIHLKEPVTHLLDELRERLTGKKPQALFVSGLEYSLPAADEAYKLPFIANLNASRNSFPETIPCPLVLWIPEYVLNAIMLGAPDFYSIRSGTYFFAAYPSETSEIALALTAGSEWGTANLTLAEKKERIHAIKSLLSDYQALPPEKRDLQSEMRLLYRLGNLLTLLGMFDSAEHYLQNLLYMAREMGNKIYENYSLSGLGSIYHQQKRFTEAEAAFKQSIEGFHNSGHQLSETIALANIGNVYTEQKRWEEAQKVYQRSLELSRKFGDRQSEGLILNNLGTTLLRQQQFSEAEKLYQQSLEIAEELSDYDGKCYSLANLGAIYLKQGRFIESTDKYRQSLEIALQLGDYFAAAEVLSDLAFLQYYQGNIKSAIELEKQLVQTIERMQDMQRLKAAKNLLKEWEREAEEEDNANT